MQHNNKKKKLSYFMCMFCILYCELIDSFMFKFCLYICPDCISTIELRAVLGVQGTLKTPFFPSYYPPDTNCTWTFNVSISSSMWQALDNTCFHTLALVLIVWFRCPQWEWACLWNLKATSWAEPVTSRPVRRGSGSSRTAGKIAVGGLWWRVHLVILQEAN